VSAVDDYREADSETTYTSPQEAATARKARAAIAELEAENERLKVCGNCKWFRAEEFQYYISAPDKCDFTPTRWEKRP